MLIDIDKLEVLEIFVIEKLWTDRLTSMREDSYGWTRIGFVLDEVTAKTIVKMVDSIQ